MGLIRRKLFIPRNGKMEKNHTNTEVKYTEGTRAGFRIRGHGRPLGNESGFSLRCYILGMFTSLDALSL